MEWLWLFIAGVLETGWAVSLKYSEDFTRLLPSVLTIVGMAASFAFLSLALRRLPLGTAYAVWTGIGTVGTFIMGIVLFGDSARLPQIVCVLLIAAGIAGLKLLSAG
jgi:quaternary ammonium compound-resistance protein SugE